MVDGELGEMLMTCMGIQLKEFYAGLNAITQLLGLRTEG